MKGMWCKTCGEHIARPTFGELQRDKCQDCAVGRNEDDQA